MTKVLRGFRSAIIFALSPSAREQIRRDRFLVQASRYSVVLGIQNINGQTYFFYPRDTVIGRILFQAGEVHDADQFESVLGLLSESNVSPLQVLDIGANIGTTSVDVLSRLPATHAHAFEPEIANIQLLEQNVLANNLTERITVHNVAISDYDGQVTLELAPTNFGDHRVRVGSPPDGALSEKDRVTTTVQAWRLDTLVARGIVAANVPSLMWIDVQGHEGQVLAGAQSLRHVPAVVEFWPYGLQRANGYDLFLSLLTQYAYIIDIRNSMKLMSAVELRGLATSFGDTGFTDLLLLPFDS